MDIYFALIDTKIGLWTVLILKPTSHGLSANRESLLWALASKRANAALQCCLYCQFTRFWNQASDIGYNQDALWHRLSKQHSLSSCLLWSIYFSKMINHWVLSQCYTEKYNVDYDSIQIFETSTVLKPSMFISCLLIITIEHIKIIIRLCRPFPPFRMVNLIAAHAGTRFITVLRNTRSN